MKGSKYQRIGFSCYQKRLGDERSTEQSRRQKAIITTTDRQDGTCSGVALPPRRADKDKEKIINTKRNLVGSR